MLYIEQQITDTDVSSEIVWYVGQPLPVITSPVVKFQADGEELGVILDALKLNSHSISLGEQQFNDILKNPPSAIHSNLKAVEYFASNVRENSRRLLEKGHFILLICFIRAAYKLGLYEAKMMADGIRQSIWAEEAQSRKESRGK